MTKITKKNSRYWDLEKLYAKYIESGRDRKLGEKLDRLYKMAQDEELELARRKLIDHHKRGEVDKAELLGEQIKKHFKYDRQ